MVYGLRLACGLALCTASATAVTAAGPLEGLDPELGAFLPEFERGTERFMNGDPAPWKANASQRDDVMILGAWGAHENAAPVDPLDLAGELRRWSGVQTAGVIVPAADAAPS